MNQYDIYKSEGGFRVAAEVCNGCPVTKSSPWFRRKSVAAMWRTHQIARDPNYQYEVSRKNREEV